MGSSDHRRHRSDTSDCELLVIDPDPPAKPPSVNIMTHVRKRLRNEANLLRRQIRMYLFCIFIILYGGSVVFRNVAFYRFQIGNRITQDLGFQLFAESRGLMNTVPIFVLQVTAILTCLASLFPIAENAPYATNILRRWGMVEAMGTVLRFATYVSTSLPGAADHCLPHNTEKILRDRPTSIRDIFLMMKVDGVGLEKNTGESGSYNCGDLVFSGHMLMTICYALTILRYSPKVLNLGSRYVTFVLKPGVWTLVLLQAIGIIMARNHYTMDVVIAAYVTPLLWHWHATNEKRDMTPYVLSETVCCG